METIFVISLVVLGALAVLDLIVGVSNDAVNFLNSAIGSKVAPRRVIMIVASIGIVIGATFSSGMMEVARNGIFHPGMFSFEDIMMLFLAVMFGDVILLDLFNTFGMPTSTTVSLVFGLLGSAVGTACSKMMQSDAADSVLAHYINSGQALAIISGILLSVVIAFITGMVVMYLTRFIFTFSYESKFKKFGAVWCGIAFTSITYFAIIKGLKGSSIVPNDFAAYVNDNSLMISAMLMAGWTAVMYILQYVFKVKILKVTVLAGTFSLALAFAGNDLVNFIGIFVAGYDSFNIVSVSGDTSMMMTGLTEKIPAQPVLLLIAGAIMVAALWFSKKAWSVTETEINLSRKDAGAERFGSSPVSRALVRGSVNCSRSVYSFLPNGLTRYVESRFKEPEVLSEQEQQGASFDLLRATVNLTTAALLISFATSYKLPLSTTYVTFMVAMGTSLSDRAWGRESAVYRITGVLTVISGWFLTALVAFTIAFIISMILMFGKTVAIVFMIALCIFLLYKSNKVHKENKLKSVPQLDDQELEVVDRCTKEICNTLEGVNHIYNETLSALYKEDRRALKKAVRESEEMYNQAHEKKYEVNSVLLSLDETYVKTGHYYVQVVDYVNEVTKALLHITRPSFLHIDNNHTGFSIEQLNDLKRVHERVNEINLSVIEILKSGDYSSLPETITMRENLFTDIATITENHIRRIRSEATSTRTSMLYLDILNETKTMILQMRNLLKSYGYFISR